MRKVTKTVVEAFLSGESAKVGNTSTDGNALFLHGNRIAEKRNQSIWITTSGWQTVITRDRLNGLPGVRVNQAKGNLFFNGSKWNGEWIEAGKETQ